MSDATSLTIQLRGARQNNLRGFDLDIPIGGLTVICGVSGSGKTSLALDTLYAEGQRRYIESFSAYTRQFLQRIEKPKFESLTNLPPSIAITRDQRARNNRSLVGTASETLEPLRLFFSKIAKLFCYQCAQPVVASTPESVGQWIAEQLDARAMICYEIHWTKRAELVEQLFELQTLGFVRLVAGDRIVQLSEEDRADWPKQFPTKGNAFVIVDRIRAGTQSESDRSRWIESLETAFAHAESSISLLLADNAISDDMPSLQIDNQPFSIHRFSRELRCPRCNIEYPEPDPKLFNFNNAIGACELCEGFGETIHIDRDKVVPDRSISIRTGAIAPWRTPAYAHELEELLALASDYGLDVDSPVSKLSKAQWRIVEEGVPERNFGGLNGFFDWLERKKYKLHIRAFLARWRSYQTCGSCHGQRLNRFALAYRLEAQNFHDLCEMRIDKLIELLEHTDWHRHEVQAATPFAASIVSEKQFDQIASQPLEEVLGRLRYLQRVGVGYVTLNRAMHSLSGGEAQRVSLTTLLGSSLVDMLYVLDEPTVGLHPADTERIAEAVRELKDRGNTVVLIEHEPWFLHQADRLIEIGPGAGELGGTITFQGTPAELQSSASITGRYLRQQAGRMRQPRELGPKMLELIDARGRNLQGVDLRIPSNGLCVVAGVSGSGKSSLILDTLIPAMSAHFGNETTPPLPFDKLIGADAYDDCLAMDQSPIARSIRSSPATYSKAMDEIRNVFAQEPEAKARALTVSHFSMNSEAGRCPTCEGLGFTLVDMQFLADVHLVCQDCNGARFQPEVLAVRYRDLNIAEVLALSIQKAHDLFRGHPKVQTKLKPMIDIGLGYLPLGQNASSLSAGESMRLKLAAHLDTKQGKRYLIVMDEPTTGLHFSDIDRLLHCFDVLVDQGHTLLVIEHNQQVLRAADHIIELGPGPGPMGGSIIATGTPSEIVANRKSVIAKYL